MSLTIFIPSKDRPAQLRLLLQSIRDNLPLDEIDEIFIIASHSNEQFAKGYHKLVTEEIVPRHCFHMETSSTKDHIDWFLKDCKTKYVLTLTDDTVVYQNVPTFKPVLSLLDEHQNVLTFTLRLGSNITREDYTNYNKADLEQPELIEHQCIDKSKRGHSNGVSTWNWKSTRTPHFSHPISLDGTIIRTEDLKMLTMDSEHENYRQWECCISNYVKRFDKNLNACFEQSVIVTIPINQVVNAEKLTDGVHFPLSPIAMTEKYLANWVVDYHSLLKEIEGSVDTPLKEFPLTYRRKRWYDWWLGK